MTENYIEAELRLLEVTANNFAIRLVRMAQVRAAYVRQIREMSASLRAAVKAGEMNPERAAEVASELRNEIMRMQRRRDFDLGKSLARRLKSSGLSLEDTIRRAMRRTGVADRQLNELSDGEQRKVFLEVVDSSGRSRAGVTGSIPRLRSAARGLWLASIVIAAYNIGTAERPWWQAGREASGIAGGIGGGFAGGAAIGAAGGVWAGPVGVAIGVVVGGVLGALLADRAYVEMAGTSDPVTRRFIARYSNLWRGVDEAALARALASEQGTDGAFVRRVLLSLESGYRSDADGVALEYVKLLRNNRRLEQNLRAHTALRETLVQLLDGGWTTRRESEALGYLRAL